MTCWVALKNLFGGHKENVAKENKENTGMAAATKELNDQVKRVSLDAVRKSQDAVRKSQDAEG